MHIKEDIIPFDVELMKTLASILPVDDVEKAGNVAIVLHNLTPVSKRTATYEEVWRSFGYRLAEAIVESAIISFGYKKSGEIEDDRPYLNLPPYYLQMISDHGRPYLERSKIRWFALDPVSEISKEERASWDRNKSVFEMGKAIAKHAWYRARNPEYPMDCYTIDFSSGFCNSRKIAMCDD